MFSMETYIALRKAHIEEPSNDTLKAVRDYLDSNGYFFPRPYYLYKDDEPKRESWRFLDGIYSYNESTKSYRYREVLNPDFKYGHYFSRRS